MELGFRLTRALFSPTVALLVIVGTLILLALSLAFSPAWAGDGVTVPIGDWVAATAEWAGPILVAGVLWLLRQLPAELVALLRMLRFEQLVERSVDAAIQSTAGAMRGRVLSADIANQVLAEAARLAIASAPRLVEWAGGAELIRRKILARLEVDPAAGLVTLSDNRSILVAQHG